MQHGLVFLRFGTVSLTEYAGLCDVERAALHQAWDKLRIEGAARAAAPSDALSLAKEYGEYDGGSTYRTLVLRQAVEKAAKNG